MLFDDGDEVVIEDPSGIPAEIVVADQTERSSIISASWRSRPPSMPGRSAVAGNTSPKRGSPPRISRPSPTASPIQQEYEKRRRAFDTLFCTNGATKAAALPIAGNRSLPGSPADVRVLRSVIERQLNGAADQTPNA